MFDPVDPKQSFPALEHGIIKYWKEEDIFKRTLSQRKGGDVFSFYDGPPFATGLPHYGHLLAGTIKDVIPRYQSMRGKYVERRFGWDCHGLPVENLIEKEHNITSHKQIEEMGIGAFNDLCRASVLRYTEEWRKVVERMGRWADMDWDYRTMDPEYMESIWWVFSELFKKDLVYEGHKPMHICPRCVTPLSNFEVTQGYKDITDQSVTVMFELEETRNQKPETKTYILAWTTTPWTLPGNLFLAVHPKTKYVTVELPDKNVILAEEIYEQSKDDFSEGKVIETVAGKKLLGMKFEPLFPYFTDDYKDSAFRIVEGDFVTTEDGTGVVHVAPGFGEDDYNVGKREGVPLLQHVTMSGRFTDKVTDFAGMEVKPVDDPTKTDQKVIAWLEENGKVFQKGTSRHSYPHCWRCDSPLLNYATSSWFVAVEKIKDKLLLTNAETKWVPAHIRDGRFGKWLEGARDWAVSRNRYWGTPLPIWRPSTSSGQDATDDLDVIGDRDGVMKHNRIRFTKITAVRHAESEGNLIPIYQGIPPGTDLTDNGKGQAKSAGKKLRDTNVKVIYCSPLARTQQTAAIIAKQTGAEVIVDDRLRELNFGEYEGKTIDFSDLAFVKARRTHKIESGKPESIYHFPGMETWDEVYERILSFLEEILPQHRSDHIIIVSHADPIQNIRHFFTKEDPVKLSHQPYPEKAQPYTFFWDHDTGAQLDLHKETVDDITWPGPRSEKSVEVTVVRHGETEWGKERKIKGNIDIPLNETGKEQAHTLAKKLKREKFDCIVSSNLDRAIETAQILSGELGIPYEERCELFNERNLGDWEKRTVPEVEEEYGLEVPRGGLAFHPTTPANGESLSQFLHRAQEGYEKILAEYPGKRILLVCHGGMIQCLSTLSSNLSWKDGLNSAVRNCDAVSMAFHPLMRRIPEVLDCWFESGSMPYAQSHFPFRDTPFFKEGRKWRKGTVLPSDFPANFIAEGIDQTRGWFYTLMVLATALFGKPAFYNCVVNGIVLTEEGKKMSKRLKNYPEPMEVVEKYGADAIRFTLMSSPAVRGEDLRFSEKLVEDSLRQVILPLWNTYSFFVTYANAAGFEPLEYRHESKHPLDRWIRAEVQDLTNRMTEQLDNYDLSATCSELFDTIDALTNWYVRLSRRRFAGKASIHSADASEAAHIEVHEEEQEDALKTLYDVLLTIGQLIAPFCPFISEAIYLNLVPSEHESIHLTNWPETRELSDEERKLLEKTRLLRLIVSLGLKVRSDKKVKIRQPLEKAVIAIPPSVELSQEDRHLIQQELNVRDIEFAKDPEELAEAFVQVDARKVGPRLGQRVQAIIKAGKEGDFKLNDNGSIRVRDEVLTPEEATVVYRGKEGKGIAADRGIVVSVDTTITEELQLEGIARDLIRGIQKLRKDAGYEIGDHIIIGIKPEHELVERSISKFGDLISQETNVTFGKREGKRHVIEVGTGLRATIFMLSR